MLHAGIELTVKTAAVVVWLLHCIHGPLRRLLPPTFVWLQVSDYVARFRAYDWLWKDDMEAAYKRFMMTNPDIEVLAAAVSVVLGMVVEAGSVHVA